MIKTSRFTKSYDALDKIERLVRALETAGGAIKGFHVACTQAKQALLCQGKLAKVINPF